MPGPPPPPPLGGPPPPTMPSSFSSSGGKGADDRGALLQSIRKGTKLKKTVTNDKSAPLISGNIRTNTNNNNDSGSATHMKPNSANSVPHNGMVLGGLFAGGMPKLKSTGRLEMISNNSDSNTNSLTSNTQRNFEAPNQKVVNSIQSELKKQMASDNKNRGPPPPAPVRSFTVPDESKEVSHHLSRNGSTLPHNSSAPQLPSHVRANSSTLHKKAFSNVNLSTNLSIDSVDTSQNNNLPTKPNHGKPNLAPKPPALNGKPAAPPKKLILNKPISRAYSMRSPKISSPDSTDNKSINYAANIGTVRNFSSVLSNTLTQSTGNLTQRPRLPLNGRPSAPPPSIPPQSTPPPPPSKMVKPLHAPPPPPPQHAPPPPPSRTAPSQPSRPPPAIPNAPPPPPRHSSIKDNLKKNVLDLETKFANMFHSVQEFPRPMTYRNVTKVYNSKQVVNKQQAPLPPNHIQLYNNKMWDTTSTC